MISVELDSTPIAPRIHLIGRKVYLEEFRSDLQKRGESSCRYFTAGGGIGKTRLEEEFLEIVLRAGPGFYCTGIIDLYHTDTHSTSDIERVIVENIDPDKKYFENYRRDRITYEHMRERGANPEALEQQREKLSGLFVQDWDTMALDAKKMVILFDTVELLQYESGVVEQEAGLDKVDARVKAWMLKRLPPLHNALIVFVGRPKPGQQQRLEQDLKLAFKENLKIHSLEAFTEAETESFLRALDVDNETIDKDLIPVVWKLTSGRPIYLHLLSDLLLRMSPVNFDPFTLIQTIGTQISLVNLPEQDSQVALARKTFQSQILQGILEGTGKLGHYLQLIAYLPKGITRDILEKVFGLPFDEAEDLMHTLKRLSIVKQYKPLKGGERLHEDWLFLHDEMYALLNPHDIDQDPKPSVMAKISERILSCSIVALFYDPEIHKLEEHIKDLDYRDRSHERERLVKLEVERMYYLLVQDAWKGYTEFKRLSDIANRQHQVGGSMRLLDEFLRFYHAFEDRRKSFADAGISYERVVRDSTEMWVERFYWWGQTESVERFAEKVLADPAHFELGIEAVDILTNICALWGMSKAMLYGYQPQIIQKMEKMREDLQNSKKGGSHSLLAKARLANTLGFSYRQSGFYDRAVAYYREAESSFRKLGERKGELAMVLNNLAYIYAKQGKRLLAFPKIYESLRITEEHGQDYSRGLTLAALSAIEGLFGEFGKSNRDAQAAREIFHDLQDRWGLILVDQNIGYERRRRAKSDLERGKSAVPEARQVLLEAQTRLEAALQQAKDYPAKRIGILSELGKVYREMGRAALLEYDMQTVESRGHFKESREKLLEAVKLINPAATVEIADIYQDLAESYFISGDPVESDKYLVLAETTLGVASGVDSKSQVVKKEDLPGHYFLPLGKIIRLRGDMAFDIGKYQEGTILYNLAYYYFGLFSAQAIEKDDMHKTLYKYLSGLSPDKLPDLMGEVEEWIKQNHLGPSVEDFMLEMGSLLSV